MGQKTIPTSLRLNKNKNWNSKWIVEKNEYSSLLHFDLEIKQYFETIFNHRKFKLFQTNIIKTSKNIKIYIYVQKLPSIKNYKIYSTTITRYFNLYYANHNIKIFIKSTYGNQYKGFVQSLGKIYRFIKKTNRMTPLLRKMIYKFTYSLFFKKTIIISSFIQQLLKKKKSHKKQIRLINRVLKKFYSIASNLVGYRLQFKGRLNGSKRKKKLIYQEGKIPLNTLKYNIQYNFNEFKTPSGICSIKLWVFFQKSHKPKKFSYKKRKKMRRTMKRYNSFLFYFNQRLKQNKKNVKPIIKPITYAISKKNKI